MEQLIKILLVPDGSADRRLRRMLTIQSACHGILVGIWPELIDQAKRAYLILPEETAVEVEAALPLLVGTTEAGFEVAIADSDELSERPCIAMR